ncbi:MAG: hypothetical protein NC048_03040 [Bacteroides sp.]|nr:hypothetical protein [Ruminococcus flavefaciens]MCM1554452.1 hypothetical protein [Bacteroides sp.]
MEASVALFEESETCSVYSILFSADNVPEFQKFLEKFTHIIKYRKDYETIINTIVRILERGAKERYFRPEGKMSDRVVALPIDKAYLRLYCIRLNDSVLIVGNGGIKETSTYQENDELRGYVLTLQKLDKLIRRCEKEGVIQVGYKKIEGIELLNFDL